MKYALLVLLVSLSVVACADDSAVYEVAGAVAPMDNHPTVRMLQEKVDVKLGLLSAQVRCEFVFKNEGPATTVKMGFPNAGYEYDPEAAKSEPAEKRREQQFESWVDGKPVHTKFIFSYREGEDTPDYQFWSVKDVRFDKGQTRTVVNKYEGRASPLSDEYFRYILCTGRNWKGSIGEATITIDTTELRRYWRVIPQTPKGAVTKGSHISWTLKDFEPEQDVLLDIEPKQRIYIGNPVHGLIVHDFDAEIYQAHGITMAPVRYLDIGWVSEVYSILQDAKSGVRDWPAGVPKSLAQIVWSTARRECTVRYRDHSLVLAPGRKTAVLDGSKKIDLPETPFIDKSSSDLPLRVPILAVAKAVGMKIGYSPKTGDTSILDRQ